MDKFILFLCDGIFGYFFQAIGYILMICAVNRLKIKPLKFFSIACLYGTLTYIMRSIPIISTGFHTMLTITLFIFLSAYLLKTRIFPTVVGVLATTIIILVGEIIVILILTLASYSNILSSDGTTAGEIKLALFGIPINVMLIIVSFAFYKIRNKQKENIESGDSGK